MKLPLDLAVYLARIGITIWKIDQNVSVGLRNGTKNETLVEQNISLTALTASQSTPRSKNFHRRLDSSNFNGGEKQAPLLAARPSPGM